MMRLRNFGAGIGDVSEIGLGCWQIGGADWGDVSEADAMKLLEAAVAAGTTFFDTADVYGLGRSEALIGKFLKSCRLAVGSSITVATKLGRYPEPGWPLNFEAKSIREHTEASLKRLDVDTLDLTQLHCIPTEVLRHGEVFDTLRDLQSEGKIRRFGASVESMEEALICLKQPGLASLQIIFNILRQKPIDTLFDAAKNAGVALIVRLPLASGVLSGKYNRSTQFASSDHRNYNRDGAAFNVGETFAGIPFDVAVDLAERVRAVAPDGLTMSQFALRYCLDFEAVTVVIPGARDAQMARANAEVSDLAELSPAVHARLKAIYDEYAHGAIRGPY